MAVILGGAGTIRLVDGGAVGPASHRRSATKQSLAT